MIRTSKHKFQDPNTEKYNKLLEFIDQYRESTQYFVDFIWEHLIDEQLNSPKWISTKEHKYKNLSQRALKCSANQACGIVKGVLDLQRRRLYALSKLEEDSKEYVNLKKIIDKQKISKPIVKVNCELNSICCDIKDNHIQFKSLGKIFGKIRLPFIFHKGSKKWSKKGKLLPSILLGDKGVDLRWEIEVKQKEQGREVGLDQGKINCVSMGNQVSVPDKDGHDLNTIQKRLERRKKGSKGFRKAQEHRKNYINASINKLNFSDIKKVNVEGLKDVRRNKPCSRLMSHWTYPLINRKIELLCEELGVQVQYNSSPYRSQRCSQCGLVLKANRKKKLFSCCSCGYCDDSDINASNNHAIELPICPLDLSHLGLSNLVGFYWLETGLFDIDGEERTVSHAEKT